MNIKELALRRARMIEMVRNLGMANTPFDYEERMKSDAAYRLAQDALTKVDAEYQKAMANMSTDDLISLTK